MRATITDHILVTSPGLFVSGTYTLYACTIAAHMQVKLVKAVPSPCQLAGYVYVVNLLTEKH